MSQPHPPILNQVNLIVRDVAASVAFYRELGLTIDEAAHPDWAPHHASALMPNGMRLEFDSAAFAKQWNQGWKDASPGGRGVLFFYVSSREDVDHIFARMMKAGYPSQRTPEDAFWGARYAIVEDPDGNPVGIMSPIDSAQRRTPPPPPPSR